MSAVVEAILHFAGYFRVAEEANASHPYYDGGWHSTNVRLSETSVHTRAPHHSEGELDPVASVAQTADYSADVVERTLAKSQHLPKLDFHHLSLQNVHGSHVLVSPQASSINPSSNNADAGQQHHYSLTYGQGGDQTVITIDQMNSDFNNNKLFAAGSSADVQGTGSNGVAADDGVLNAMVHQGSDQIPQQLALPVAATTSLSDFIKAHDERWAAGSDSHDTPAIDGSFHNGVAESAAPPVISAGLPALPDGTPSHPTGQALEVGGNTATNGATIVDGNETAATKIVLGDWFQTDAIMQSNVLSDRSHVGETGGQPAPDSAATDHADNFASFINNPTGTAAGAESADGLSVHVETITGDFYNIHSVTQTNVLSNGNMIVQNETEAYSKIVAGDDQQQNIADVFSADQHYDVVIVEGDYHEANLIYQENVVLNQNNVKTSGASDPSDPTATETSVKVGYNQLQNKASIEHDGSQAVDGVTSNMTTLAHQLALGEPVDESLVSNLAGTSQGSLNVLMVTGSYYDINVVSQTNVISNINVASQQASVVGHGFEQTLAAGGNVATNAAQIIDVGSSNQANVGGGHYSDSLLIQANLVQSNHDPIVHSNTDTLVTEAIAFIGGSDVHQSSEAGLTMPGVQDHSHTQDLLGQVMA